MTLLHITFPTVLDQETDFVSKYWKDSVGVSTESGLPIGSEIQKLNLNVSIFTSEIYFVTRTLQVVGLKSMGMIESKSSFVEMESMSLLVLRIHR